MIASGLIFFLFKYSLPKLKGNVSISKLLTRFSNFSFAALIIVSTLEGRVNSNFLYVEADRSSAASDDVEQTGFSVESL